MICVKLVIEEGNKTTYENLDIQKDGHYGKHRILLTDKFNNSPLGIMLTNEDFEYLYNKKIKEKEQSL